METLVDVGLRNAAMAVLLARWRWRPGGGQLAALTHALGSWCYCGSSCRRWHVTVPCPVVSLAVAEAAPPGRFRGRS